MDHDTSNLTNVYFPTRKVYGIGKTFDSLGQSVYAEVAQLRQILSQRVTASISTKWAG